MPCLWPFWRRASCGTNRHPTSYHIAPASAQRISLPSASGPHAPPPPPARPVCLHNPTARTWPWEKPFLANLLAWLRALQWTEDTDTVSFIELALNFEERAAHTLTAAPQAKFQGQTLPLQERARVLRLALCTLQTLVKLGSLHPATFITRATSLVPLGGPLVAGLNRRPYFACRDAMHKHVNNSWLPTVSPHGRYARTRAQTHIDHTSIVAVKLSEKSRRRACSVHLQAA